MSDQSQKPKVFVSLVAQIGAGKDEFVRITQEFLKGMNLNVAMIRFSDPLFAICSEFEISPTRDNLQKISAFFEGGFPRGRLTAATRRRALASEADIVILNGVRWLSDEAMVRALPNHIMVYIQANERTCYDRRRLSSEKPDEAAASFEEFQERNWAVTEIDIKDIGSRADTTITNNGTLEEFRNHVRNFLLNKCLVIVPNN